MSSLLRRAGVLLCSGLWLLGVSAPPVHAHEGHDHGDAARPPPAPLAAPRLALSTSSFEVVGVLDGAEFMIWVDRSVDNSPVLDATVEIEWGGKVLPAPLAGDVYRVSLAQAPTSGRWPIAVMVIAPGSADALAGVLDVPEDPPAALAAPRPVQWRLSAAIGLAALGIGYGLGRRSRRGSTVVTIVTFSMGSILAGSGDALAQPSQVWTAPVVADRPQRSPDGSLFLPKVSQRLIGLRTAAVESGAWPLAVTAPGRVVLDPRASGRVHSSIAGRLTAMPRGLPGLGDRVTAGEAIARIEPAIDPVARSERLGQLAALEADRQLAASRLERLRRLEDTVPRREVEAAAAAVASIEGRLAASRAGLQADEVLRAPVSGRIARVWVVAGQQVVPRDPLYEIVDPLRLRIEVATTDPGWSERVKGASLTRAGRTVSLRFVGAGRALVDQTLPLVFEARGSDLSELAVDQPVAVTVMLGEPKAGLAVPASAIVRSGSGEAQVWVKTGPEHFEPRRVATEPLDAHRHRVTAGLAEGDTVVTEGAAQLAQFR